MDAVERHVAAPMRAHWRNFLQCVDTRSKPVADIEQAHISSASCILANNAMKLGREFTWDAAAGQVIGDKEANRLLRRPYRAPWIHPEPDKI